MKRFCLLLFCLLTPALSLMARQPVKALIVTGQNNHNWPVSHVILKNILENSGLFTVDVARTPPQGGDMSAFQPVFQEYAVVVLDYNGDRWSPQTEQAFLDYLDQGGGLVVYHAANNAFADWAAFNRATALGGWGGRNEQSGPYHYWQDGQMTQDLTPGPGGSHGDQHAYVLQGRDTLHPIVRGLPGRWMHAQDELYDRMRGPGNLASLLYTAYADPQTRGSGREEPMVFTVDYAPARIFHLMLGHVEATPEQSVAMQCTGFQVLLLRGTEWAATGEVTQAVPADFPTAEQASLRPAFKAPEP